MLEQDLVLQPPAYQLYVAWCALDFVWFVCGLSASLNAAPVQKHTIRAILHVTNKLGIGGFISMSKRDEAGRILFRLVYSFHQ